MHVLFWHSEKPRERILAEAFATGVRNHGDTAELRALEAEKRAVDCDVACMVGVKSRELYRAHWRAGTHTVMLDKGYTRHSVSGGVRAWEYWRLAVDAHHPTHHLERMRYPADRAERLGMSCAPWRASGDHVVFAGSSTKYHDFYDLPDPTQYAQKVIKQINKTAHRKIIYRPKPSWKEAVPVDGAEYSQSGSIADVLRGAHVLVTHGSNAVYEAVTAGVPCIVLGDAVARPVSSTDIADLESPRLATEHERQQWLANLAYCQWNLREMSSGEAWQHTRPLVYG